MTLAFTPRVLDKARPLSIRPPRADKCWRAFSRACYQEAPTLSLHQRQRLSRSQCDPLHQRQPWSLLAQAAQCQAAPGAAPLIEQPHGQSAGRCLFCLPHMLPAPTRLFLLLPEWQGCRTGSGNCFQYTASCPLHQVRCQVKRVRRTARCVSTTSNSLPPPAARIAASYRYILTRHPARPISDPAPAPAGVSRENHGLESPRRAAPGRASTAAQSALFSTGTPRKRLARVRLIQRPVAASAAAVSAEASGVSLPITTLCSAWPYRFIAAEFPPRSFARHSHCVPFNLVGELVCELI